MAVLATANINPVLARNRTQGVMNKLQVMMSIYIADINILPTNELNYATFTVA